MTTAIGHERWIYAPALLLAVSITLGLCLLMQALISNDRPWHDSLSDGPMIRFTAPQNLVEPPPPPPPVPPEPQLPKELPASPQWRMAFEPPPPLAFSSPGAPTMPTGPSQGIPLVCVDPGGCGPGAGEGEVAPIVAIQTLYPRRAALVGLEGYVTVAFTVTVTGQVRDAHVVDADPPRVFDRAALKAIARWRFKPRRVDGIAVPRQARQTLVFELD